MKRFEHPIWKISLWTDGRCIQNMLRRRKPRMASPTLSIPFGGASSLPAPLSVRKRENYRRNTIVYQILGSTTLIFLFIVSIRSNTHNRFTDKPRGNEKKSGIITDSYKGKTHPKRRHRLGDTSIRSNLALDDRFHSKDRRETIRCPDGSSGLLNDDFCDCLDGSDESRTAACSHLNVQSPIFDCGDGDLFIFASRVKDGIKDCPNGSDERT